MSIDMLDISATILVAPLFTFHFYHYYHYSYHYPAELAHAGPGLPPAITRPITCSIPTARSAAICILGQTHMCQQRGTTSNQELAAKEIQRHAAAHIAATRILRGVVWCGKGDSAALCR